MGNNVNYIHAINLINLFHTPRDHGKGFPFERK